RQKSRRPLACGNGLRGTSPALRDQHDKSRQVRGLAAQTIGDPRTHRGPANDLRPGVHERVRRIVVNSIGGHGADDADVVRDGAEMWEEFCHFRAATAESFERRLRSPTNQFLALELSELLSGSQA